MLFTLIAERYERRSLGITSNLVFSQWEHIFANPMATAAAHRPGGPPLGHPRVRRPQLSHQRRAAAQCTGGEPARIVVVDRALPQPKRYLRQVVASDSMLPKLEEAAT